MKTSFAILIQALAVSLTRYTHATGSIQTCLTVYPIKIVEAYTNWPFRIDCSHLEEEWKEMADLNNPEQLQCIVTYNGSVFNEGIFELSSVTEDNIYRVELVANDSHCLSSEVVVQLRQFPGESCNEIVNGLAARGEMKFLASTIGDRVELRCIPPDGTPTLIPEGANREEFKTHWHTECTNRQYRYNNLWKNVRDPDGFPDKLRMPRVDFYDATNFTCAVTYRGRTLYPITYGQCIKQNVEWKKPSVSCVSIERGFKGGSTHLDCTGQIAMGATPSDDFMVEWVKDDKVICRNNFFNQTAPGVFGGLTSCEVRGNNDTLKCVPDYHIDESEIQKSRKKLQLSLNIRHLKDSDYGQYSVSIKYRDEGIWLESKSDDIVVQEIEGPSENGAGFQTYLIIISLVVLSLFVALAVIIRAYFR